jgi:hypothetical protein
MRLTDPNFAVHTTNNENSVADPNSGSDPGFQGTGSGSIYYSID